MQALGVVLLVGFGVADVALTVLLIGLVGPYLRSYSVAGKLRASYLGNLYSDRWTVLVLTRGPGERQVLAVRSDRIDSIPYEELWRLHEASDVRWMDNGFETFEAAVRESGAAHPGVTSGVQEHRRKLNRQMWLSAVVLLIILAAVLYLEIAVLHVSFARI